MSGSQVPSDLGLGAFSPRIAAYVDIPDMAIPSQYHGVPLALPGLCLLPEQIVEPLSVYGLPRRQGEHDRVEGDVVPIAAVEVETVAGPAGFHVQDERSRLETLVQYHRLRQCVRQLQYVELAVHRRLDPEPSVVELRFRRDLAVPDDGPPPLSCRRPAYRRQPDYDLFHVLAGYGGICLHFLLFRCSLPVVFVIRHDTTLRDKNSGVSTYPSGPFPSLNGGYSVIPSNTFFPSLAVSDTSLVNNDGQLKNAKSLISFTWPKDTEVS